MPGRQQLVGPNDSKKLALLYSALNGPQMPETLEQEILTFARKHKCWALAKSLSRHPDVSAAILRDLADLDRADILSVILARPDCPDHVLEQASADKRARVMRSIARHPSASATRFAVARIVGSTDEPFLRGLARNEALPVKDRVAAAERLSVLGHILDVADVVSIVSSAPASAATVAELRLSAPALALTLEFCVPTEHLLSKVNDDLSKALDELVNARRATPFRTLLTLGALVDTLALGTSSDDDQTLRALGALDQTYELLTSAALSQEVLALFAKLRVHRPEPPIVCAEELAAAKTVKESAWALGKLSLMRRVPALAVKAALDNPHCSAADFAALADRSVSPRASWTYYTVSCESPPEKVAALMAAYPWLGPDVFLKRTRDPVAALTYAMGRPVPDMSLARSSYLTPELVTLAPVSWVLRAQPALQEWAWDFARSQLKDSQWSTFVSLAPTCEGSWRDAVMSAKLL